MTILLSFYIAGMGFVFANHIPIKGFMDFFYVVSKCVFWPLLPILELFGVEV